MDVVTIGNHETDYGIAHLLFIEKCAKFPIINANLHIKTNGARLFKPYHIMNIDGMKILFIGILTEDVISQTKNDGLIGSIVDINEAAQEVGKICNAYNAVDIDFTVLFTHIGFEEDKKLAEKLDPAWGVRVVYNRAEHCLREFALNGEEICDERIYKIGLQYFHFNNVENFFSVPLEEISQNGKPRMVSTSCRVILDEYLSSHQGLDREISGRLIVE